MENDPLCSQPTRDECDLVESVRQTAVSIDNIPVGQYSQILKNVVVTFHLSPSIGVLFP